MQYLSLSAVTKFLIWPEEPTITPAVKEQHECWFLFRPSFHPIHTLQSMIFWSSGTLQRMTLDSLAKTMRQHGGSDLWMCYGCATYEIMLMQLWALDLTSGSPLNLFYRAVTRLCIYFVDWIEATNNFKKSCQYICVSMGAKFPQWWV